MTFGWCGFLAAFVVLESFDVIRPDLAEEGFEGDLAVVLALTVPEEPAFDVLAGAVMEGFVAVFSEDDFLAGDFVAEL